MRGAKMSENNNLNEILPEYVVQSLEEILINNFNITNFDFSYTPITVGGENLYAELFRITIDPKINSQISGNFHSNGNKISFIVKMASTNEARRKQMNVALHYEREVFTYEKIIKEYLKFQNIINDNKENHLVKSAELLSIPRFYYASLKPFEEFIILEDLNKFGYKLFNRKLSLPIDIVSLTIKEIAKFHAMGFILRENNAKLFTEIIEKLEKDILFNEDIKEISIDFGKKYIEKGLNMLLEDKDVNSDINAKNQLDYLRRSVLKVRDNFKKIGIQMVNGHEAAPFATICHGDFWSNNLLYKYNEYGLPESAKILDFQCVRYAAPVLDFIRYLFTCTEKELRDEYFENLKQIYYNSIKNQLELLNMDADIIYPLDVFEDQLKGHGVYGLCMAAFSIPFFISASDEMPDLDEVCETVISADDAKLKVNNNPVANNVEKTNDGNNLQADDIERKKILDDYEILNERTLPIFKKRMVGVILDMEKYGMLDRVWKE